MSTQYFIEIFNTDRDSWVSELKESVVKELKDLEIHGSVEVVVTNELVNNGPTVGVYFGSPASVIDMALCDRLEHSIADGRFVAPVVDSLANFSALVPPILMPLNGFEWSGSLPALRLARRLLEELGIEDRRRRMFISHKREDGLGAAGQLHDFMSHNGFEPFIDRFAIGLGEDVQRKIADALEDCAFLILLETPLAHSSKWVFDEVQYAQSHQMGMHIVTWPDGVEELPATNGLPRQILGSSDLKSEKGYDVFTDAVLEKISEEVEELHANALVRRRRFLLNSVKDAVDVAGLKCTPLENWRLLVEKPEGNNVVQVSSRLPTVNDLHRLDKAKEIIGDDVSGVLVHSARELRKSHRELLSWATGMRNLTLIPENAVGGYWK